MAGEKSADGLLIDIGAVREPSSVTEKAQQRGIPPKKAPDLTDQSAPFVSMSMVVMECLPDSPT